MPMFPSTPPSRYPPLQNRLGSPVPASPLPICRTCGTQYSTSAPTHAPPASCRICLDPRQYVPPTGQKWTSLAALEQEGTSLTFTPDDDDDDNDDNEIEIESGRERDRERVTAITIKPGPGREKIGIGQRAFLIRSKRPPPSTHAHARTASDESVNILWDLVCYLDSAAIERINRLGGLAGIVVSHPHFWTTWSVWSRVFGCPVFLAGADREWLCVDLDSTLGLRSGMGLGTGMGGSGDGDGDGDGSERERVVTQIERDSKGTGNGEAQLIWVHKRTPNQHDDSGAGVQPDLELCPGISANICGGHFPGSMALLATREAGLKATSLFHADTIHVVPSALNPGWNGTSNSNSSTDIEDRNGNGSGSGSGSRSGNGSGNGSGSESGSKWATYTFMYSVPNMIPLNTSEIKGIVRVFETWPGAEGVEVSHGLMQSVRGIGVRGGPRFLDRLRGSEEIHRRRMTGH